MEYEAGSARQLWVEDERGRRRMPDPVRTAAVRAVLITSVTVIQAMVAFFSAVTSSWLAFPMLLSTVGSTVVATWSVLDVWVTRQVWRQRNGVVSEPSSTARPSRRERRRTEKAARAAEGDPGAPGARAEGDPSVHAAPAGARRAEAPALTEAARAA
ncbi:hypothetical protein ACIPPS_26620 [Streptomyces sp. NPDC090127]|uniref:hypothetical protein n=1 Tax=Streptomyces sp. NPDC090127 TaxID=3365953 RepID=UPI0038280147